MNGSLFPVVHVSEHTGLVYMLSIDVADSFSKQHKNILQNIRLILEENRNLAAEFSAARFPHRGKKLPCYRISETGVLFLIAKLGGKTMDKFKMAVSEQFTAMRYSLVYRDQSKIAEHEMCKAIHDHREDLEKETLPCHYINENTMVDRLVLGCTMKKYREKLGLSKKRPLTDFLTSDQIHQLTDIRKANSELIEQGMEHRNRKALLSDRFVGCVEGELLS